MEVPNGMTAAEAARQYLDAAIQRHRDYGDDQKVPDELYERALTRTTQTVVEFTELESRRTSGP